MQRRQFWWMLLLSLAAMSCSEDPTGTLETQNGYCVGLDEVGINDPCTSDGDCNAGLRCYIRERNVCLRPCSNRRECGGNPCLQPDDVAPTNNASNECLNACQHLGGCLNDICGGPAISQRRCRESCVQDPDQAAYILALSCTELQIDLCISSDSLRENCECPGDSPGVTNTGSTCEAHNQCESDNLLPFCLNDWPGGYCSALGCHIDAACGSGNACIQISSEGDTACFKACQDLDDCREEYFCQRLSPDPNEPGICFPDCQSNEDCPDGTTCQADGSCS